MTQSITSIPELDNSPSFIMGLAYKQFRTLASQALLDEFDISLEMLGAMRTLIHLGKVPQQTLAESLRRERSVTKRLVDNCIKRGLLEAHKSDTNKKARYLTITDKGREIKEQADCRLKQITNAFFAPLDTSEITLLHQLCRKLIQRDLLLGSD
ncbi:MarR family winged helix-turn-helix transcriptional regulator [Photobacterium nomapromontoriensis]|uniref:MarR family winged helix-turn-helix transcriptional regulator n=1 Tax=Photobacterium nomapromontoriensis TaxID=2910237 RepID=UPI003D0D34B3